jgi:hypothetical protein
MNPLPKVADLERIHDLTWGQLVGLEPQLAELLWQARAAAAGYQDRQDVRRVFAPFRQAVTELVGWQGRHRSCPLLGSVAAYEVAYWKLHETVAGQLTRPAASGVSASDEGMSRVHHERKRIVARKPRTTAKNILAVAGTRAIVTAGALPASLMAMLKPRKFVKPGLESRMRK